jgi:hypothetical protein
MLVMCKSKENETPVLNWLRLRHEDVWGSEYVDPRILDLGNSLKCRSERYASHPGCFTPRTYWIGGWVGPKTGLDDVERRKILPLPGLELLTLGCPGRSQWLYQLCYPDSRL